MMQHPSVQQSPLRISSHKNPKPNSRHRRTMDSNEAKHHKDVPRTPTKPRSAPLIMSPTSERYAGGAYQNSPTACSLPAPSFEETPSPPLSKSPTFNLPVETLFLENSGIFAEATVPSNTVPSPAKPVLTSVGVPPITFQHPSPPPSPSTVSIASGDLHFSMPVSRSLFQAPYPHAPYPMPVPGSYSHHPVYYPPASYPTAHPDPYQTYRPQLHSVSAPQLHPPPRSDSTGF